MSYTPTNWKAGDTVTSAKLNKIEQGISNNGPLVVHITNSFENGITSKTMDKTWLQIREAAPNVCFVEEHTNGAYYLKNYQLVEMGDSYIAFAPGAEESTIFPPSITLLDLNNQNTYKFIISVLPSSESENPVWTYELPTQPEIPKY